MDVGATSTTRFSRKTMEIHLNEICKEHYEHMKAKGFHNEPMQLGTALMLVVSELGEALEADRKMRYANIPMFEKRINESDDRGSDLLKKHIFKESFEECVKDTIEDEIADTFLRLFDLCGAMGIDIDKHIELKMRFNKTRQYMHGKKY